MPSKPEEMPDDFNYNTHCENCYGDFTEGAFDGVKGGYLCRACMDTPAPQEAAGVDLPPMEPSAEDISKAWLTSDPANPAAYRKISREHTFCRERHLRECMAKLAQRDAEIARIKGVHLQLFENQQLGVKQNDQLADAWNRMKARAIAAEARVAELEAKLAREVQG